MDIEKKRQYNREYNKRNREKLNEYKKSYYEKNKEKMREYHNNYNKEHKDLVNERHRNYYKTNKEKVDGYNNKWRTNNKEKFNQCILKRKKERAIELREQGQIYVYLNRTARENKMVESLSKKFDISLDNSRELLVANNWNYVKIVNILKGEKE